MQIKLNSIAFDVKPVDGALRGALLADPVVTRGSVRAVWEWDKEAGRGRFLVPATAERTLPLPTGLISFVPKAGPNGGVPQKAEGPTAKMSERILAAVGAKDWGQLLQAVARVTGVPQQKLPLDAFAPLNPLTSYQVRMAAEFQVVELSNASRNLAAYLFLPGLAGFVPVPKAPEEGVDLPAVRRPLVAIPPVTQAALAMRRIAVARRLNELQGELGDTRPVDLAANDPRRIEVAKLGAEWRVLQPKAPKAA